MTNRVVFFDALKTFIIRLAFCLLSFFTFLSFSISGIYALADRIEIAPCQVGAESVSSFPSIKEIFEGIFNTNKDANSDRQEFVYLGGQPLGFTLECEGVLIIATGEVLTDNGFVSPTQNKNIKEGDLLYSVDGVVITSASHLHSILNGKEIKKHVDVEIRRNGQTIKETLTPAKETSSNMYRLGLWIRDNAAGVGTLTYVRASDYRFGALGHPVCDVDTGVNMPVSGGSIYKCNIVGYNKGSRGNPGELRGLFLRTATKAGTLDTNNNYGVYGYINPNFRENLGQKVEVAFKDKVKTGKAQILSTIDGTTPKAYDIEIVKLVSQSKSDKKSMVIKVIDKELIAATGGIVQGMSGSPIIQNGKLVGAVTHVFVSDPTKGFGIYIDWMIDN